MHYVYKPQYDHLCSLINNMQHVECFSDFISEQLSNKKGLGKTSATNCSKSRIMCTTQPKSQCNVIVVM